MCIIQAHPLCHHCKKPRVKPVCPPCIVIRYTVSQSLDMVLSVPSPSQAFEEVVHRIKNLDKVRLRISSDVFVPHINPIKTRLDRDCIAHPFIRRHKRFTTPSLSDLCTAQGRIISHLILPFEIVKQTTGYIILQSIRPFVMLILSFNTSKIFHI